MPQPPPFQANPQTLLQLLQPGQGLYVPVYQRSYTWGADQIDRLFEDVNTGLNRAALGAGPATFLGSVILFEGRSSVAPRVNTALPAQVLHVVDGQQRMTTLLVILGQLRVLVQGAVDRLEQVPQRTPVQQWALANLTMIRSQLTDALWVELPAASGPYVRMPRLIRQATDTWGDQQTNARYTSDIAYYLHAIAVQELDNGDPPSAAARPHLKLALDSVNEHVGKVVAGGEDNSMLSDLAFLADLSSMNRLVPLVQADAAFDPTVLASDDSEAVRLAVFAQFLLGQVIVIDVRAPDEETAFSLFEPLNTTGQPLTPIETLRPLAVTAEGGLESYVGKPSDLSFQRVAGYVPDELGATERAKRVSSLLTSFALGQDGTKLAFNMLDQRRYLRTTYAALPDLPTKRGFVDGIADTASFLSDVWEEGASPLITMGTEADRLSLEVLRASNHVIVVPLLVRYFERAEQLGTAAAKRDFRAVVRAAAAFWTLWRSSRSTTSGIDDVHRSLIRVGLPATGLAPLARSSTPVAGLPSVKELRRAFRSLLNSKLGITDAASWSSLVNAQPIYDTTKILARYILVCAHDDGIYDTKAKGHLLRGASGTWRTRSLGVWNAHYSVEHIAPQRKRSTDTSYATALYDEGDINRLGNLTLLPPDLNGLVGNQTWPFKRDVFKMVSKTNPKQRVAALKKGNLYQLGAKSKTLLESADFIPFCKFVARYPSATFDRAFVSARGRRLAELAWERLWADLS
jgi:hypothetical protein